MKISSLSEGQATLNSAGGDKIPSMDIKGTVPKYDDEEAHLVRRLGWAVIEQWKALPEEAKRRIAKQAVFVHDRHETVQLQQQIDIFIHKYTGEDWLS